MRCSLRALILIGLVFPMSAVAQAPPASAPPGMGETPASVLSGLDLFVPHPRGRAPTPEAIDLGRRLFFDPGLSADSSVACATCHDPTRGFADTNRVSVGVFGRVGNRNVPTLVNRIWGRSFFWDGRIETLETQVLQPIVSPVEMDMLVDDVVDRLSMDPEYVEGFGRAFDDGPSEAGLAAALAAYVGTIRAADSPFDRLTDGDPTALGEEERRGLELFQGRARCVRCHTGPLFTDESFHNTGVAWVDGELLDDGRARVTGLSEDRGAFKTPTLREVARTAPYMHDGSLESLEEVVDFYDEGGRSNPHLDPLVRPLGLTDGDKAALVAFLQSLSGRVVEGDALADGRKAR